MPAAGALPSPRLITRYALAVSDLGLMVLLRWVIDVHLGNSSEFETFYLAVILAAIVGGAGPGVLVTVLGAAAGFWMFTEPRGTWGAGTAASTVRLLLYLATGLGCSLLAGWAHAARRRIVRQVEEARVVAQALAAAHREAERARAAVEQASRAKDHFLAVLSHELRNPLTPVLAAANLLESDRQLPDRYREDVEMIRRNAQLEARLIDDLLDVTRIARGRLAMDCKPVSLGDVLGHAVEVCRADLDLKKLHLDVDVGPAPPYLVHADTARLQQVFWNLLKNAIKFTPAGGRLAIRCRPGDAGFVVAEVSDNGRGIAPELLPHIFNAFEQGGSDTTRQFGGLGLGLAITKGLVEQHGGSIEADSEGPGRGAIFRVSLPLASAEALPRPTPTTAQPVTAAEKPTPSRILLVEDNPDTARLMRRLLMADGHDVEIAADMATALDAMSGENFDLLISDLGLPDGSGFDLMRKIAERGERVPAIALSGYGQEQDVAQALDAGFSVHLTKPVDLGRLAGAIADLTGKRNLAGARTGHEG